MTRVRAAPGPSPSAANEERAARGLPWDEVRRGGHGDLHAALKDLNLAARLAMTASPETIEKATEAVTEARKAIDRLLAED